jgi:hypothetical protein
MCILPTYLNFDNISVDVNGTLPPGALIVEPTLVNNVVLQLGIEMETRFCDSKVRSCNSSTS